MYVKRVLILCMFMFIMMNGFAKSEDIDWSRLKSHNFDLEPAHIEWIETWMRALSHEPVIAIVNFSSRSSCLSTQVINEAELFLKDNDHTLVDRDILDNIRREKNIRLNDRIKDEMLINIGKLSGAETVITGAHIVSRWAWLQFLLGRTISATISVRVLCVECFGEEDCYKMINNLGDV